MINAINRRDIPNHKLDEIIQAGDALKHEVQADAAGLRESGGDASALATALENMAAEWDRLVSDYRSE